MARFVFAALSAAALSLGAAHAGGAMSVPLDEVRVVTFAKPVATLYVGNPVIADVMIIDSRHAFVQGKAFGSTNVVAQLTATRHGAGVGLLPCFLAEPEPDLVRVLHTDVRFILAFSLSQRRDSPASDAVRLLRAALHRYVVDNRELLLPALPRGRAAVAAPSEVEVSN